MNFKINNDRKISIKKGVNFGMIAITIIIIAALGFVLTSKLWIPDNKPIMNRNYGEELTFNSESIISDKQAYKDTKLNIGQIGFVVNKDISQGDDLSFKVYLDDGREYPKDSYKVIKSEPLSNIKSESQVQQYYILQFALPKEFYYLKIIISQKGYKSEEINLDYRNFKEKKLSEKDNDYLVKIQPLLLKISIQKQTLDKQKEEYKGIKDTLDKLKNEIKTLQVQISLITDKNGKEEQQKIIDEKQKTIRDYEDKYKKIESQVNENQKNLDKLNEELKQKE